MIAGTGVQRIRPKDTDNSFNTGFSIYDGSSGFKFWTNREKYKELKAALGTQSKSLKVGLEVVRLHLKLKWTPPAKTGDWTANVASWDA